ncbi:copper amine oxidase N-terminal domain-containing protein [Brevibacillus laterosporus]|uniref:copper amine oxidase N-terminal domain-containing protein n=1 Tax=Brevibacillus laterosporus TaxID=1465 RepID=UPI0026531B09|nr:copper amine oxidase N-terminal domain-containing protein [Brevibacillus laterosporus]MDN9010488.1 copper amine oxidase N-terminal domain-containing protein [Brevibacillus laterosporus]MDO0941603.1 copper amine oxidase N-terminal domain-containing protein [Brevibacillus laterosporus]
MFKKKTLLLLSSALLIGALPATTDAAVVKKNIQATYNNVKVKYNGYVVPTTTEPFIVNGTTYIPLRMMAGVFNKDVSWDQATFTVSVGDRIDPKIAQLQAEIAAKDSKISTLEKDVSYYRDQLDKKDKDKDKKKKKSRNSDVRDLEDDLNKKFGKWEKIKWNFDLSGDEDDLDVTIEIDLGDYKDEYKDLSESEIKKFIKKVCEFIWDERDFEDADIDGKIYDTDDKDDLWTFEGKSKGKKVTYEKE